MTLKRVFFLKDKISKMTNEELSNKYNIGKETVRKKG